MAEYVCTSEVCEWRNRCQLHKSAIRTGDTHVIYFCPPEDRSGSCPHLMLFDLDISLRCGEGDGRD